MEDLDSIPRVRNRKSHSGNVAPSSIATKPLPTVPQSQSLVADKGTKPLPSIPYGGDTVPPTPKPLPKPPIKPLPAVPDQSVSRFLLTLSWILGFAVWFLLVVVLLPVIMERDAMPGLNTLLRNWVHNVLHARGSGEENGNKDERTVIQRGVLGLASEASTKAFRVNSEVFSPAIFGSNDMQLKIQGYPLHHFSMDIDVFGAAQQSWI
ncbi:hypothetical protein K504DRAFT_500992 [Pleomassaria siparia CBS 279.74]|uniref:Uncharacterized protein n=1 Tax=Pleomassaria siparia CBS 279.74 TaxID=1314801 RepID=A0A6G1KDZ8_9PLEO|nr:hypothetical protein K504DRAFT_500992 [Pleomassaria siparia CBS 279.74]